MKKRTLLLFAVLFLFGVGCSDNFLDGMRTTGDTVVTLQFDLLNYLEPSQESVPYGENPVIPGSAGSFILQPPAQAIDLTDELEGVSRVDSVDMDITLAFHSQTGQVGMTYRVYLAGLDENPLETAPIISESVDLNGLQDVTRETHVEGDDQMLALFNDGVLQYSTQLLFEIADGSENVSGTADVVRFDVRIVATP